jgi:hypothetical protein
LALDNIALRRIVTPKTKEVMALGKLHSGELYNCFSLLKIIRQKNMEAAWARHVALMERIEGS